MKNDNVYRAEWTSLNVWDMVQKDVFLESSTHYRYVRKYYALPLHQRKLIFTLLPCTEETFLYSRFQIQKIKQSHREDLC